MKKVVATKDETQRFVILSHGEAPVSRDHVSLMITRDDYNGQRKVYAHVSMTKDETRRLIKALVDSL